MDNIQFWIYVIVVVITLIARANKKKPQAPTSGHPENEPAEPSSKPISFEDLLREIQEAKSPKKTYAEPKQQIKPIETAPSKQYDFEDYDDEIEDEVKKFKKQEYTYQDDEINKTYEQAKRAAFERPSLEETLKVQDTVVKFNQFKEYAREEKPSIAAQIRKDLKEKENFKKAFILSEVLNRRF